MIHNKWMRIAALVITLLILSCSIIPIIIKPEDPDFEPLPIEQVEETVMLLDVPVTYPDLIYQPSIRKEHAEQYKEVVLSYIYDLNTRCMKGEYTEEAMLIMADEEIRLWEIIDNIDAEISKFDTWLEEYPYAAETWFTLRELGYSEEVTAGIIGNMMIETGGGTLNLKPTLYSSGGGFYGLCQWSLHYRPNVADMSFENQLMYLHNDMPIEFSNFGFCYKRGFTYEDFCLLDNAKDAAKAFARVYERPASKNHSNRARCAMVAYEYFTSEVQS